MGYVIGVDEVGRGCLAGDVFVAAVMVPEDMDKIEGVDASKHLGPPPRETLDTTPLGTPGPAHLGARDELRD